MLLQYEDVAGRRESSKLTNRDLDTYNDSMVTFEREVYQSRNNGAAYDLAMSLCCDSETSMSDCASTSIEWRYR